MANGTVANNAIKTIATRTATTLKEGKMPSPDVVDIKPLDCVLGEI
jgi:hypothetical protein